MLELRPAAPEEAGGLTELCLRSKAVHGYDDAFIAACRIELTVHPGLPTRRLVVAVLDRVPVGVAEFSFEGEIAELEKLFVEPDHMGGRIGRTLFEWVCREAASVGAKVVHVDADPGAEGFYLRMGAIRQGLRPSGSIPGRHLPHLRIDLHGVSPH